MKIEGTGSGSISQRHGSADTDPDPHQNVMDPQHWFWQRACRKLAALHCTVRPAHAKFACHWWPVAYKFYLSGRQMHANCTLVAASHIT